MTSVTLDLTNEEVNELHLAFEAHYDRLVKKYGYGSKKPNNDWDARTTVLAKLRSKLIQAELQGR